MRSHLFPDVLALAREWDPAAQLDQRLASGRHPLSRFRINLGDDKLALDALSAAAALAFDQASGEAVAEAVQPYLFAHDAQPVRGALHAVARLEPEVRPVIGLVWLANHADPGVRTDLAHFICQLPAPPARLVERLASDANPTVREAIALNLGRIALTNRDLD